MGERATKPGDEVCSVCAEPSVTIGELPLDGGLVRYCLKHLREHDPAAADFLQNLRRRTTCSG
jgi:hypothetical protein